MSDSYNPDINSHDSWAFAIDCLRAEFVAGRDLTPLEMVEAVDAKKRADE